MIRARFYIRKDDCDNDYRPVKWPIKYPYWCSAESSNSFVLVAYAEDEDSIKELWPEAYDINVLEKDTEIRFTLRFPKPEWYELYEEMYDTFVWPIKTNVKKDELKQVRIIPQATCYVVEVVYERKETDLGLNKDNFLSIDLGLNNLCSCISNVETNSFIINGRVMKSVNQWYNKKKAKLMSFVGNKGTSNRIRKITLFRNCWIEDKLHKISRYIVDFCKSNNIGTIIIGLNKEWKNEINIGKRNNQHFVSIPHSKLIDKIVYKANLLGIEVITHEESYTSKIDHLAFEPLKKQESYLGKRKKRGLFQSSVGKLINADINGAIGIARKVVGDSFIGKIIDSGFVFNPVRINIL